MVTLIFISSLVCLGLNYCFWYQPEWTEAYYIYDLQRKPSGNKRPNKFNREIFGLIHYWVSYLVHHHIPFMAWILKPLFMCPMCMASVYGSLVYWGHFVLTHQHLSIQSFAKWLVILVATVGLNRVLKSISQI